MGSNTVPLEIKIAGISGYNPLYVPVADESDIRAGYLEPVSPKISNDPNVDVTVNLSSFPAILDLSGGAWAKFHEINNKQYHEPVFSEGSTTPLAWTACPEAPLLPGCGWNEQNGAYAFKQIIKFKGDYYGLDIKNNEVWKNTGGAAASWTDTNCGAAANVTSLALDIAGSALMLGNNPTGAGDYARRFNGSTWSDYSTIKASHFLAVGDLWFYVTVDSQTPPVYRHLRQSTTTNYARIIVGLPDTPIMSLAHIANRILIGKPEGVFLWNGIARRPAQQIFYSRSVDPRNCNFLTVHGGSVYFAADDGFYEYDPNSNSILSKDFALFDGTTKRAFYGGRVLNAWSDGRNLWLIFQVGTSADTPYYNTFLVLWNTARGGGFHPIFVNSTTTDPVWHSTDTWRTASAIWFDSSKLRYSLGYHNSTGGKTGYLMTDGSVPIASASYPYTWNVGITLGWMDMSRDWIDKWLQGVRLSTKDLSSEVGGATSFALSYQKWSDTSFTAFPSGTKPRGTKDNLLVEPTAESGNQAGFTTSKLQTKIVLENTADTDAVAWVQSLHWIGTPVYSNAFHCTIIATLNMEESLMNLANDREYVGATVLAGLKTGIVQKAPVTLTMPDGNAYVGTLEPAGYGDILEVHNQDTNAPKQRRFAFAFKQYA